MTAVALATIVTRKSGMTQLGTLYAPNVRPATRAMWMLATPLSIAIIGSRKMIPSVVTISTTRAASTSGSGEEATAMMAIRTGTQRP